VRHEDAGSVIVVERVSTCEWVDGRCMTYASLKREMVAAIEEVRRFPDSLTKRHAKTEALWQLAAHVCNWDDAA